MKSSRHRIIAAAILLQSLPLISSCERESLPIFVAPHPVSVVTLQQSQMSVISLLSGRVQASRIAEVRPQVDGVIQHRLFTEGSRVKEGDALFQIEPAVYKASLVQAIAELDKATAALHSARVIKHRFEQLVANNYVSRQDYDTAVTNVDYAHAQVVSVSASVDSAKLNLSRTVVRAPISGVTGKSFLSDGALVSSGQSEILTTVQQLDPVFVELSWPVDDYVHLQQEVQNGGIVRADENSGIILELDDGHVYANKCDISFSDVTVDKTTSGVVLRAVCPNSEHSLLPGMFVRAHMTHGIRQHVLFVPHQAVSRTPEGNAKVMVVDNRNRAQIKMISVAEATKDLWRVTSGLKPGDKVIVTGHLKLRPGMPVSASENMHLSRLTNGSKD